MFGPSYNFCVTNFNPVTNFGAPYRVKKYKGACGAPKLNAQSNGHQHYGQTISHEELQLKGDIHSRIVWVNLAAFAGKQNCS